MRKEIDMKENCSEDLENCFDWGKEIFKESYPPDFNEGLKEEIKQRDGYECQNCGATERLDIHHIDYNKGNLSPWNLITLCKSCNMKANHNKTYWKKFYQGIIKEIYSVG